MKKQITPFIAFWILDSLLLFLATWAFPYYFTLGNKSVSLLWAVVVSGFVWTFLEWIANPIVSMAYKVKGDALTFGFYFVVNFVALWLTARMAPVFGFGARSFVWLAYLAILADVFQYFIWKYCGFKKMK